MDCKLCNKKINTKKEKYNHIEDWEKEKLNTEIWCHFSCFEKAMNRDLTRLEKQAQGMLNTAQNIFNSITPKVVKM